MTTAMPRKYTVHAASVYRDPDLAQWLGSFEGIPEGSGHIQDNGADRGGSCRHSLNRLFQHVGDVTPGVALAAGLAAAGHILSDWLARDLLHYESSPVSALAIVILLGVLVRNIVGLPPVYLPGLHLCLKRILRVGIAMLGIRMSLMSVGAVGLIAVPVVLVCIGFTLAAVGYINRCMGLPPRLGSLIAVGTSICGISAIAAAAPTIDADDSEVSYSIACVAIFGLLAMLVYPWLSHWVFPGDSQAAGILIGTAIHDTAQVAGAGLMFQQFYDDPAVLNIAVVTKLIRNLCMIGVIPLIAVMYHNNAASRGHGGRRPCWYSMVPLFVIGFVGMAALRTLGELGPRPFGILDPAAWEALVGNTAWAASICLVMAMSAVGLGTDLRKLTRIGWRPFAVGLMASVLVGMLSICLISLMMTYL